MLLNSCELVHVRQILGMGSQSARPPAERLCQQAPMSKKWAGSALATDDRAATSYGLTSVCFQFPMSKKTRRPVHQNDHHCHVPFCSRCSEKLCPFTSRHFILPVRAKFKTLITFTNYEEFFPFKFYSRSPPIAIWCSSLCAWHRII